MPARHSTRRPSRFQTEFDFDDARSDPLGLSKQCTECGQVKPLSSFFRPKVAKPGRRARCQECRLEYQKVASFQRQWELVAAGLKRCSRCGETKPLDDFSRNRRTKSGRRPECKPCQLRTNNEYRRANRDHVNAWANAYNRIHAERKRARAKVLYDANPEPRRAYSREYARRYPDWVKARRRRWSQEHALEAAEKVRRRYARLKQLSVVPITAAMIRQKFAYWGHRCWMCGKPAATIDHVKPLSKGGPHILANLRPACRSCNSSKGARWPFHLMKG
jgi:5-methylcytosine-specific restriction endonuclease McrA